MQAVNPRLNFSSVAKKNLSMNPNVQTNQNQTTSKPKLAKDLKSCKSQIRNMEKILMTLKETIAGLEADKLNLLQNTEYLLQSNSQLSYELKKEQEKNRSLSLHLKLQAASNKNSLFNMFANSKSSLNSSNTQSEAEEEHIEEKEINPIWSTCFLENKA